MFLTTRENVSFPSLVFSQNLYAHSLFLTGQCCKVGSFQQWDLKPGEDPPFINPYYVPEKQVPGQDDQVMLPTDDEPSSDENSIIPS